jgi:hypothetical protein
MSGHTNTKSDKYVAVLGTQFSPDAAPSSANMTMDLGPSQNLLTCRLTKAVCSCITSPGEGNLDCQSLSGRLDWSEEIANPSPLDSQNDSRAKWVGKTALLQSRHTTAFVEWSSAVYSKTSEIGVSDAPTGRSDLRRLNRLSELSPAMTLSGMRQLIDSDRSPASFLLVSHPCSYRRGRSVGTFSSVRRAGRLHIGNGHAGTHRRDVVSRPVWTAQQGLPLGSKQGYPWVPGTSQGPMGLLGTGDVPIWSSAPREIGEPDARANYVRSTGVAVLPGGAFATRPVRPAPTGTPHGSALAANRSLRVPGNTEGPPGSSGKGDVMIHRPCLTAWLVGNPTPASAVHPFK